MCGPPNQNQRINTLLLLHQDIGTEVRSRREPEHLFTAATIGALGAVAWGVATISTIPNANAIEWWRHPALAGALMCILVSASVLIKIVHEATNYRELRNEQVRLSFLLAGETGVQQNELPPGLQAAGNGPGYLYSSWVIVASATGAVVFCLAVFFAR